jgi:predicted metal-binding membrane protein
MKAEAVAARRPTSSSGALVAGLVGLCAAAWLVTLHLATPHMRVGLLTSASRGQMAPMGMSSQMALGPFMAGWIAMMAAMMVPALVPVVAALEWWTRASNRPRAGVPLLVAGYLLVWSAVGLVAYAVLAALQDWTAPATSPALRLGAALLVVAGAYQLTHLKRVCVRQCRSPLPLRHLGPLRAGIIRGLYSLGCCWALMLVLLLLGMMNLIWMAAVTLIVLAEEVAPKGELVRWFVGLALMGLGITLFAAPQTLPALA